MRSPLLFKKTLSWLQLEGAASHRLLSPLLSVLYAILCPLTLCARRPRRLEPEGRHQRDAGPAHSPALPHALQVRSTCATDAHASMACRSEESLWMLMLMMMLMVMVT